MRGLPLPVIVAIVAFVAIIGGVALVNVLQGKGLPSPGALAGPDCAGASSFGQSVEKRLDPQTGESGDWLHTRIQGNCEGGSYVFTQGSKTLFEATGYSLGTEFSFTLASVKEQLSFPVTNDKITIWKNWRSSCTAFIANSIYSGPGSCISPTTGDWLLQSEFVPAGCSLLGNIQLGERGTTLTVARWGMCPVGTRGHLAPVPRVLFNSVGEIVLDDGQVSRQTITSTQTSARWSIGNDTLAMCNWAGSLVTGEPPPDATSVVSVYNTARGSWNLASLAEWSAYERLGATVATFADSGPHVDALFDSVAALSEPGTFSADGTGYLVDAKARLLIPTLDCYFNGKLLHLEKASGLPSVKVIGIEQTVPGQPPAPYYAGNPGVVHLSVGNAGNFTGSFSVAATCGGAPLQVARPVTVAARAAQSVDIDFAITNKGTHRCEAMVTDSVSGAFAKAPFTIEALEPQRCQPGLTDASLLPPEFLAAASVVILEKQAIGLPSIGFAPYAFQCAADGAEWEILLDCSGLKATVDVQCVTLDVGCISVAGVACPEGTIKSEVGPVPLPGATPGAGGACPAGTIKSDDGTQCLQEVCLQEGEKWEWIDVRWVKTVEGQRVCRPAAAGGICKEEISYAAPAVYVGGEWQCADGQGGIKGVKVTRSSATAPTSPVVSGPAPARVAGPVAPTAPQATPGFEAVFAVAGLLIVSYLISRRRRGAGGD